MTHLEIIIGASIIITGIWFQWWIDRRQIKRAQAWAEHWHRKFMDCPRSIAVAAENGFEHGHKQGWEDCLDAIEHDKPAQFPITATITALPAIPGVTDPASLAALDAPQPSEWTIWQNKITDEMLDGFQAAYEQMNRTLESTAFCEERPDA